MICSYKELYIDNQLCLIWDNILPDSDYYSFINPLPTALLKLLPNIFNKMPKDCCVKFLKVYNNESKIDIFRIYRPLVEDEPVKEFTIPGFNATVIKSKTNKYSLYTPKEIEENK